MKKLAAVLFSLLLVASVSVGCTKKEPDPAPNPDTEINAPADPDDNQPVTLPDDDHAVPEEGNKPDDSEQPEQPEVPTPDAPADLVPVVPENPDDVQTPDESINLADMELADIVDKIYEAKAVELTLITAPVDLTNTDSLKYMTGLDNADKVKEAVVSEPMIGSIPYSLVLVRVKNSTDTAAVAESMKSGINTRKWVCVEADDLGVSMNGDLVLLFMIGSDYAHIATSAEIIDAFNGLEAFNGLGA